MKRPDPPILRAEKLLTESDACLGRSGKACLRRDLHRSGVEDISCPPYWRRSAKAPAWMLVAKLATVDCPVVVSWPNTGRKNRAFDREVRALLKERGRCITPDGPDHSQSRRDGCGRTHAWPEVRLECHRSED